MAKQTTEYKNAYKETHYKTIVMAVRPEIKKAWVEEAQKQGKSLTSFIVDAVNCDKE